MVNKQIRDVLDTAKNFHKQLSDFYRAMSEASDKERIKILLDYMSRHEAHLEECLSRYEKDGKRDILDRWFKQKTEQTLLDDVKHVEIKPDMNIGDVMRIALDLDDKLIRYYKRMAAKASSDEARDLFNALLEMEKREKTELVRNAIEFEEA